MVKLARASLLQFSVSIIETVVGALATLYFARLLGAGVMGSYFLALAVVNWVLMPSGGLGAAVLKRISEGKNQAAYFTAGLSLQTLYGLAVVAVVLLAHDVVNDYVAFDGAALIGATAFGLGIARISINSIRAENRVELASLLEGGRNLSRIGLQFGFVGALGLGVVGLMAGEVVAAILALLAALAVTQLGRAVPRRKQFVRLYEFGRYAWFGKIKVNAYSWTDTLVLGLFVTTSTVGVYEIAWRASALFILLPASLATTVFPTVSRHASNGETEPIQRIITRTLSFAAALAIPGAVGALVLGPEVLGLYGPEFVVGGLFLIVLSIARIAEAYERILIDILNALDYPDRAFRVGIVFVAVNTVLNVLLVSIFGAIGAAVGTLVSISISLWLAWRVTPSAVKPRVPVRALGVQASSAVVMGAVLVAVNSLRPIASDWDVLAYVFLGVLVYAVGVVVGSPLARRLIRQILRESFRTA